MDYSGEVLLDEIGSLSLSVSGISPNVAYSLGTIRGLAFLDTLTGVADSPAFLDRDALVRPEPGISYEGEIHGCFEALFEKIVVSPRIKACGYVLADIVWSTNVWNTHRNRISVLNGAHIQDSGNVRVDNPLGYPLSFAPFQGRDFTTIVPQFGDATIRAIITFTIPGEEGTDVLITGSRIVIFSAEPDWSEPVRERTQYLTDVLTGYSAKEQRIALRKHPRSHLGYRIMPIDTETAAAIEALLHAHQARTFGVPFWPDAQKITQSTPMGSSVIYCDTANRKFSAGGIVVLWRDFFTNEAATILSVSGNTITTSAPLNNTWTADGRTYAIPVLTGRWVGDSSVEHLSPAVSEFDAEFQCEPSPDVNPATLPQVYGHDVLDRQPNSTLGRATGYRLNVRVLDAATGITKAVDRSGRALGRLNGFLWTMQSRDEIAAYRAWFSLRKGQSKAFWVPSWRHDLVQAADLGPAGTHLVIKHTGYARYQYPDPARRYLCFTMLDGSAARYYRKVTEASEGATTETLVLDSPVSGSKPVRVGSCMISFLRLVRLASDESELIWHSRDVGEVQLDFIEVPFEVPA